MAIRWQRRDGRRPLGESFDTRWRKRDNPKLFSALGKVEADVLERMRARATGDVGGATAMYAVIKTGGKQYRVAAGQSVKIEAIEADPGSEVTFGDVLAIGEGSQIQVGTPTVAGATVKATVLAHGRHPKVTIFKMRRRKHFQKHGGHRQNFTEVRIDSIA